MSNFDPNAIIRGAQLTVVGGEHVPVAVESSWGQLLTDVVQRSERCRIRGSSSMSITDRPSSPSPQGL